jgi:hypothetical protein
MNNLLDDIARNPHQTSQSLQALAVKHQIGYLKAVALNRCMKYSSIVSEITEGKIRAIEKIASGQTVPEKPAEKVVYDKTLVLRAPGGVSAGTVEDAQKASSRGP